ncbi:hypoxanthine phosphoribosyltransferase [candidate division KSB1 bacterium]|nr:hypoxanthine phosphoribosyltransferase [candidate division KSB1 bacterium]
MDYSVAEFFNGKYKVLITKDEIHRKVKELAHKITVDYKDKCPVLIGVLNGAFIFMADLVKELHIDCEVDFIKISSYGNAKISSGKIDVLKDINCHLEGRHVLIIEDIVDSGLSVKFLENLVSTQNPASLKFVSLMKKMGAARINFEIDYLGFEIPNEFVVGYGLDYCQKLRNLPAVYLMN